MITVRVIAYCLFISAVRPMFWFKRTRAAIQAALNVVYKKIPDTHTKANIMLKKNTWNS